MIGELVLALGCGLALVICGTLAWWGSVRELSRSGDKNSGHEDS